MYKLVPLLLLCGQLFATPFQFEHAGNQLVGEYLAPKTDEVNGLIVFVHGDGAANYDSNGYYPLYWQALREQGYYVASWSKPGVGDSSGNWLRQTMSDRQAEILAGTQYLQSLLSIQPNNSGLLAFSQGGWVAPALADSSEHIGFLIGVGFARNWIDQGRYYNRLAGDEAAYLADVALLEQQLASNAIPSNERRWFVLNNFKADATSDYQNINIPSLLIWGDKDANVDTQAQLSYWQSQPNPNVTVKVIENGTHQLLDANKFPNRQLGFWDWLKFQWQGEQALAPDALSTIEAFLDGR
ncbi:alpha/beta hydrolase family protein [Salinibius halmophilus]|uniref:alpha/beta hydrolase family protein n=1 Tax=Salinibius halmophilus TaxID=1853216 RepID=UPI000E673E7A|nr:alpha/beta hydrolase [Salinibius halmophilus]